MTPAGAMMDEFGERCQPHSFHRLSVTGILSLAVTSVVTVILIDFLSSLSSDVTPLTEVWEAARSGRTDKTFCCCCSCSDLMLFSPLLLRGQIVFLTLTGRCIISDYGIMYAFNQALQSLCGNPFPKRRV